MIGKLVLVYSVVFVYLASLGLTHLNQSFALLSFLSMGFIWGFMANECLFDRTDPKLEKFPITEGACISNIKSEHFRQMPSDPPPSLSKKQGEYDFSLTLSGINELTDGQVDALFQAGCDDATPCVIGGKVRLDFSREAPSYEEAISSAIRDVRRANIGAEVDQIESDKQWRK